MATNVWGAELAEHYDEGSARMFEPAVLGPTVDVLASHHWPLIDGQWVQDSAAFRYVWPSELDLMARLAGLGLEHRWSSWDKSPFTGASTSQIAVYLKP